MKSKRIWILKLRGGSRRRGPPWTRLRSNNLAFAPPQRQEPSLPLNPTSPKTWSNRQKKHFVFLGLSMLWALLHFSGFKVNQKILLSHFFKPQKLFIASCFFLGRKKNEPSNTSFSFWSFLIDTNPLNPYLSVLSNSSHSSLRPSLTASTWLSQLTSSTLSKPKQPVKYITGTVPCQGKSEKLVWSRYSGDK